MHRNDYLGELYLTYWHVTGRSEKEQARRDVNSQWPFTWLFTCMFVGYSQMLLSKSIRFRQLAHVHATCMSPGALEEVTARLVFAFWEQTFFTGLWFFGVVSPSIRLIKRTTS